jgi:hypothetical protein
MMRTPRRPKAPGRPLHAAAAASILPLALSLLPLGHGGGHAAPVCGIHCGTERWHVKTLSDTAASQVVLDPQSSSVSQLVAIGPPTAVDDDTRADAETKAVKVDAELVGYKQELSSGKGDHDYHIVIRDPRSKETMIIEIPDPQCDGVCNSVARDKIQQARDAFSKTFATHLPGPTFVAFQKPIRVTVVGVPLFDFHHGQTGVAKNCLEIHPVLDISFPDGPPTEQPAKGTVPPLSDDQYNCVPE